MDAEYQHQPQGAGVRVALGSGVAVFLMGAIFWAGATYNRVQGIEIQLNQIQAQIGKLGDFQAIQERSQENSRRLDKLEDQVHQLK